MKKSWGRHLLAALAVIIILFSTACTGSPFPSPTITGTGTVPVSSGTQVGFEETAAKVLPSVLQIEVSYGSGGAPGNPSVRASAGTGWIFREDGIVVTNHHVIDGAGTVTVIFPDGSRERAVSVLSEHGEDVAIIKISRQGLPALVLGNSSTLRIGQPVAAVGNALNLGIRLTQGIVTRLNVPVTYDSILLTGLIETDAAINPGNSGGVLINLNGEVVGVPNAGLDGPHLDIENFGYAIAINDAVPFINRLIDGLPQGG